MTTVRMLWILWCLAWAAAWMLFVPVSEQRRYTGTATADGAPDLATRPAREQQIRR
jgi:hypothetical protein